MHVLVTKASGELRDLRLACYMAEQQKNLLQYLWSTQVGIFPNPVKERFTVLKLKRVIQTSYKDGEFFRLHTD